MTKQEEILAFLNAYRDDGRELTLENAKGAYIGDERAILEQRFSKEQVNEVFGEPGHLEKAGEILDLIENELIAKVTEREYLIDIAYQISNACGELGSNHVLWEKYATLYSEIPIEMMKYDTKPLDYPRLEKNAVYVTADELTVAKNWLKSAEAEKNRAQWEYLNYIFGLVHVSLKQIFQEVKTELYK